MAKTTLTNEQEAAVAQPSPQPEPVKTSDPGKLSVSEWAKRKGLVEKRQQVVAIAVMSPIGAAPPVPGIVDAYDWSHNCAATLHGWKAHAHHAGKEIELSEADYDAALKAASEPAGNDYVPHPAALSPFKGLGT